MIGTGFPILALTTLIFDHVLSNCTTKICSEWNCESQLIVICKYAKGNETLITMMDHSELPYCSLDNRRCALKIENSNLTVIEPEFFTESGSWNYLFLNNTNIEIINAEVFFGFSNLIELYLQDNHLEEITDEIFYPLLHLKILDLSRNNIKSVNNYSFMGLSNLKLLRLNNNSISVLSKYVFRTLEKLEFLDISSNPLESFYVVSRSLLSLNISNVNLFGLDKEGNDVNLETSSSRNMTLYKEKKQFSIFCSCFIKYKPDENKMVEPSNSSSFYCSKLEVLNLSSNFIEIVSSDALLHFDQLITLDLHDNKLKNLLGELFHNLLKLKYLDLSHNQVEHLPFGIFENLNQITELNLSFNRISVFNFLLLRFVRGNPITLYLHNNMINDLSTEQDVGVVRKISLDNNPWECDKLSQIISFLESRGVTIIYGTNFKREHVHRIGCDSTKFLNVNEIDTKDELKNSNYVNEFVSQIEDKFRKSTFLKFFVVDFDKTIFYKFFNEQFPNSAFYKYLQNLNVSRNQIVPYPNLNSQRMMNPTAESRVEKIDSENNTFAINSEVNGIILYSIVIALYGILCILCFFLYLYVFRNNYKYNVNSTSSHVELL